MENNRNDNNQQQADKSKSNLSPKPVTLPEYPNNPAPEIYADKSDKSQVQNQTNSGDNRRDGMNKPSESGKSNVPADSESMQPKHQTPEHLQNHKSNKDQVTNKDSDQSGSKDTNKQDNTVSNIADHKDNTSTSKPQTSFPETKKQQNHNVDDSVMVEDEDEADVISDDVEGAMDEESNSKR